MKQLKFLGRFTNANVQKSLQCASKANIIEAGISTALMFGIGYLSDLAWHGTIKGIQKLQEKKRRKEEQA